MNYLTKQEESIEAIDSVINDYLKDLIYLYKKVRDIIY